MLLFMTLPAAAQYQAADPTRLIPDARVIGLGYSFIGLAEGTGAIFTNPAGLAESTGWQVTSMSGKFLDEYSYLSFSGLYPTNYGVFGLAYVGTSIAGAWATTIEAGSDPADPIYTFDFSQPEMGNRNGAVAISYGNRLDEIPYIRQMPLADRLSFGTTLKLFTASLYGDGITNGDGSGFDMDIGAKFKPPLKWLTLGGAVKNLVPMSMGGKLKYASGHEETYSTVVEGGSVVNIFGKKDSLALFGEHELKAMLGFNNYPTIAGYPIVWRLGLEWMPMPLLTVRAAIDQDAVGTGTGGMTVVADNAFGVGLNMGGFNFDYAYHTFAGMPSIDNHYFSLSYSGGIPVVEITDKLVVNEPKDKLITFDEKVKVAGIVLDPSIRKLKVNNSPLKFGLKGNFNAEAEVATGKNKITFGGYDAADKLLQFKKVRVLRLIKFPDIPAGFWVEQPISLLAMQKVITGYPDGTFKPEGGITRAEMCSLLIKTKELKNQKTEKPKFKDVTAKHWAASYIEQAALLGAVLGYPDGTFRPNGKITRAEGLAMIVRFAGVSEEVYANQFPDVTRGLWASRIISGAFNAGVLEYLKGKEFEPKKQLTRAETVEMLHKTKYVQGVLAKDLLDWESY